MDSQEMSTGQFSDSLVLKSPMYIKSRLFSDASSGCCAGLPRGSPGLTLADAACEGLLSSRAFSSQASTCSGGEILDAADSCARTSACTTPSSMTQRHFWGPGKCDIFSSTSTSHSKWHSFGMDDGEPDIDDSLCGRSPWAKKPPTYPPGVFARSLQISPMTTCLSTRSSDLSSPTNGKVQDEPAPALGFTRFTSAFNSSEAAMDARNQEGVFSKAISKTKTEIEWRAKITRVRGLDKSIASSSFQLDLPGIGLKSFKLILLAKAKGDHKGEASFRRAKGKGFVALRCLEDLPNNKPLLMNVSLFVGNREIHPSKVHDFSGSSRFELGSAFTPVNFVAAAMNEETFSVRLRVKPEICH